MSVFLQVERKPASGGDESAGSSAIRQPFGPSDMLNSHRIDSLGGRRVHQVENGREGSANRMKSY